MSLQGKTLQILSIDAWRYDGGWTWNNWFKAGTISGEDFERIEGSARKTLRWMRENGYLKASSAGMCSVEDDQYNLVICDRSNGEPLFAIEYGAVLD
jgi:hypothetical protein